ncbi:hypothetical protein RISK_002172 [Rhodopirellula islandica]|uniref:Uncharacterized protein n=1 Tax=Rhodopirellula islandica TaxID=595434 RepID=A0A0J1BG70_RHOIS|nr:hypothetical protein RISK_002172 [Rhodopirellula islandica]
MAPPTKLRLLGRLPRRCFLSRAVRTGLVFPLVSEAGSRE